MTVLQLARPDELTQLFGLLTGRSVKLLNLKDTGWRLATQPISS